MNELKVIGKQEFLGVDVPVIEGGFGDNQKVILAKTVAEIHNMELRKVNELIKNNIDEFEENVDIVDLKSNENFAVLAKDNEIYSQNALNASTNIYLLSEQGYFALVSLMRTDKAKEIRKELRREYFSMREQLQTSQKDKLLLQLFSNDPLAVANAHKQLVELETKPLKDKIMQDKPLVEFANQVADSSNSIEMSAFAKIMKDENINIGRNKLFEWLRNKKYLRNNNEPYQKYIDMGIFELIEQTFKTPYGTKTNTKCLVTGKGQIYLVEKLREENI